MALTAAAVSWYLRRSGQRGLGLLGLGFALLAAGDIYAALLRPLTPLAVSVAVQNFFFIGAVVLIANGVLTVAGCRRQWLRHLAIGASGYLLLFVFLFWRDAFGLRGAILITALSLIELSAVPALVRARGPTGSRTPRTLAYVLASHAGYNLTYLGLLAADLAGHRILPADSLFSTQAIGQLVLVLVGLAAVVQLVNEGLMAQTRSANAFLASAFQATSDGFALFDAAGGLVMANQRVRDLLPDGQDRLRPGTPLATIIGDDPAGWGLTAADVAAMAAGHAQIDRLAQLRPDLWLRVIVTATAQGGTVICWADISDFKRAELLLADELQRERDFARLRGGFIDMASHEFRTPLAVIDIAAQRLALRMGGRDAPDGGDSTQRIRRAVQHIVRLIDTMFETRGDDGQITLRAEPCDLATLVQDACRRHAELAGSRRLVCDLGQLPPRVECDAALIDRAVTNLIGNAEKYAPGTDRIEIRGWTEGSEAALSVTDFGIGIPEADRHLVFEPHFRATNALPYSGTGMGLSIVRDIIRLHGGSVAVDSAPGRGTTFVLRLPLVQPLTT